MKCCPQDASGARGNGAAVLWSLLPRLFGERLGGPHQFKSLNLTPQRGEGTSSEGGRSREHRRYRGEENLLSAFPFQHSAYADIPFASNLKRSGPPTFHKSIDLRKKVF